MKPIIDSVTNAPELWNKKLAENPFDFKYADPLLEEKSNEFARLLFFSMQHHRW